MRVGLFTDVYLPCVSGLVTAVDTLKKALELRGHKVFIITTNSDFRKRRYVRDDNIIKIPGVPSGIYDYNFSIIYPFKAEKIIKHLNLDIIHSHTELTIGRLGKNMAKKLNIPFIQTLHTMYEEEVDYVMKGHLTSFSKKVVARYISNFYNKNINEIIVPSEKTYNELKSRYKIKTNINVVPNGVDLNKFKNFNTSQIVTIRKQYGINELDFVILFVGRLGYEKNISFLIEAHKKLVLKNKGIKLLIVGDGPEYEFLSNLVFDLDIADNVIFTRKVAYQDISSFYHVADVLVTASKNETQGLTLIEALASSLVVCPIKSEVFLSVVKPFYNGVFFHNKFDYVFVMNSLINNKEKLSKMKKNTVSSVSNYSLHSFAINVERIYERALKQKDIN